MAHSIPPVAKRQYGVLAAQHSARLGFLCLCLGASALGCSTGVGGPSGDGAGGQATGVGGSGGTIDDNGHRVFPQAEFNLDGAPYYSRAVLLTNAQWGNAVKDLLGLDSPPAQVNSFLAPVEGFTLFPNNERVLEVTNEMRGSYQLAAAEIAVDLLADSDAMQRIDAGSDADTFIRSFGRRAFRRPLTEQEVAGYLTLYNVGAGLTGSQSEFVKGTNLVIEGMLQSPHFLYRTELSPDGSALTPYEVAAKLSFWVLGTTPSDELLDRVAGGQFNTPEGVAAVADEMLAHPAASAMIVDLYSTLFKFTRYRDVLKDDPQFTPAINQELEEVSRLFFEHIYEQDMGLEEILTSTQGFVGPLLADYYAISPAPASPTLMELGPGRPGYFAQVPYLMLMGDGGHSDAIHRGVFLNFQVMCAKLVLPPGVIPGVPAPEPNQTDRERIEEHTGFGTCGEYCHGGYINPLGYALENFDGLGRVRDTDNGKPVDTSAAYPISGQGMVGFNGAAELMPLLAGTPEAHSCFAKSLMSYALSRDIIATDKPVIDELATISRSDVGSIKGVLRALVQSPTFLSRPGAM